MLKIKDNQVKAPHISNYNAFTNSATKINESEKQLNQDQKQPKSEKQKGWFSFINEKLSQWPLWLKLTSSEKKLEASKEVKKQKKIGILKTQNNRLPWHEYLQRGPLRPYYCYLHNKQDKNTYFYPMKRKSNDQIHIQVQEIPERQLMFWPVAFVFPTQQAIELIKKDRETYGW